MKKVDVLEYVGSERKWNAAAQTERVVVCNGDDVLVEFGGQDAPERLVWVSIGHDRFFEGVAVELSQFVDLDVESVSWGVRALCVDSEEYPQRSLEFYLHKLTY